MPEEPTVVTGLGKAESHRVLVCGYDLDRELVGRISFAEMTSLVLRGRLPAPKEARMLDALLVVLVEHGLVSAVIAARLVYHAAPEAIQAAVAAGLCGAGSVQLGSSESAARMLSEALPADRETPDLGATATTLFEAFAATKRRLPGIGHRVHVEADPRVETLFRVARETEVYGKYCRLIQELATVAGRRRGRVIPVNVTGAIAAIALDMGFPWQLTKAFALIGRTLGIMGHIAEEMRNPVAPQITAIIRRATVYEPWRTRGPET